MGIAEPGKYLGIRGLIPGKVKIFDKEPVYDEDDEITTTPVAQLRNPADTYTLERSAAGKKYWMVFYPKNGVINLTVTFQKKNTQATTKASVGVTQGVLSGAGSTESVFKTSPAPKATFNDKWFQKAGAGTFLVLE